MLQVSAKAPKRSNHAPRKTDATLNELDAMRHRPTDGMLEDQSIIAHRIPNREQQEGKSNGYVQTPSRDRQIDTIETDQRHEHETNQHRA